jgi:hypothetical protein
MPCLSHSPWLDHSIYVWRGVQVMKLIIMQFPSISRHIIPLWSKYSPQHSVLKHPQSMFLNVKRPSFAPIQNHRQNYRFVYSNFYVLDSKREDKRFWTEW